MLSLAQLMLLVVIIKYVDGNQRIVQVSEESELPISDDEDFFTSGEGSASESCCVYGNSLDHALSNLTTSNVLINITTDVTLSSLTEVSHLENVSIIGHNNPTVNCKNGGAIHFTFCHTCVIQGIIWNGCGQPGLKLKDSSNITIQNCSFKHSIGKAILLSEVSGDVNINHCKFVNNTHYRGHGSAIHYSFEKTTYHSVFTINNCNFAHNKAANSLVYIESSISEHNNFIILHDSKFYHNQGVSIYVVNGSVHLYGKVLFQNNVAKNGPGIYISDHSTVTFGENSDTTFIKNSAIKRGGAVFLRSHSNIVFAKNSIVAFDNNNAFNGIIYCVASSNVTFKANCHVTFSNNSATRLGAAIYSSDSSHVTFTGNSQVTFNSNSVTPQRHFILNFRSSIYDRFNYGGIIYCEKNCVLSFEKNSTTMFVTNTATIGGAILVRYNSHILFKGDSSTVFSNNTSDYGGAICTSRNGHISFKENSTIMFSNNNADQYGGAIYTIRNGHISFEENSTVMFSNNNANRHGGAIHTSNVNTNFEGNSTVTFNNNTAKFGGAIYTYYEGHISFEGNSTTTFNSNSADVHGGAIHTDYNSRISFEKHSHTLFINNTAHIRGGAIYILNNGHISIGGNSIKFFSSNSAGADGGAVYTYNGRIYFEGNSTTVFSNNTAANGGAIRTHHNGHISFKENSTVMFSNNTADHYGGAIYISNGNTNFEGNCTATFSNNTAEFGGAIYTFVNSPISFEGNSTTMFSNNIADGHGGAIHTFHNSQISFKKHSYTLFSNNAARVHGGAIHTLNNGHISIEENSTKFFSSNSAGVDGGAIYTYKGSIYFKGNSTTVFNNNTAFIGGAIRTHHNSRISFESNSTTIFSNNTADHYGGAIHTEDNSQMSFEGNSTTEFSNNIANNYGGALFTSNQADIIFHDNTIATFINNKATIGGTAYSSRGSKIITKGNSTVIFNGLSAKWCNNACLPYTGESNVVTIDSSGIVWCNNKNKFLCTNKKCSCRNLKNLLNTNKAVVRISDKVILSSVVSLRRVYGIKEISIIGHNNLTVICINGGGLNIQYVPIVKIIGITWIGCGTIGAIGTPAVKISHSTNTIIQRCSFKHSMERAVLLIDVHNLNIDNCIFVNNNNYRGHGAAIDVLYHNFKTVISNCELSCNGYAKSLIYIKPPKFINPIWNISNCVSHNNQVTSIYLSRNTVVHVNGKVLFENNTADNGAGIYISDNSTVVFGESSIVRFINNSIYHSGAAVFQNSQSSIVFENNSTVTFNDNKAVTGTIYSKDRSEILFKGNCQVTFNNNSATKHGSAIHSINSHIKFAESSNITFSDNAIHSNDINEQLGGTIFSEYHGYIFFEENSTTLFRSNIAAFGAAIFAIQNSSITFKNKSRVRFINNIAQYCGVLTSAISSTVTLTDNTEVTFNDNKMSCSSTSYYESPAGAICTFQVAKMMFSGHSVVTFTNNTGGGVVSSESNVIIEEYSIVTFNNNIAQYSSGGALACSNNSTVTIKDHSNITFNDNEAIQSGGAIHSYNTCKITFKDNSISSFNENTARDNGGAIFSNQHSEIIYEGNSTSTFAYNIADNGGALYLTNSSVTFKEISEITFHNNNARRMGGVGFCCMDSEVTVEGITTVIFDNNVAEQSAGVLYCAMSNVFFKGNSNIIITNNTATLDGGALYFEHSSDVYFMEFTNITFSNNKALYGGAVLANNHSNVTLTGNSVLTFISNKATQSGGAGYFNSHSNFIINENVMVRFDDNIALNGGAVCFNNKNIFIMKENSTAFFHNNSATVGGGAVNIFKDSSITLEDMIVINFTNNRAQYGAAMFLDTTAGMVNNSNTIHNIKLFKNNIAKISGNLVYQDVDEFCNSSCLSSKILGISNEVIVTPPNELKFSDPAICIDDDNDKQCNNYYVQNIMLGREIVLPACVLDYYNHSVDSTQFLVESEINSHFFISGPKQVLISCDTLKGIYIMGHQAVTKSTNFSINITLNVDHNANWKQISTTLNIELSPCHPGFWQYFKSQKCECYNASDIVFCSGSSSTIKRGYWFGIVTGKPTVTSCPNNYCNFTCCEASNGYYHLSPVRDNQCRSHRSGAACGSCTYGYTLSFDSAECVNVESCTAGQMVLVILLTVIYWIVLVILVFAMMYYKVGIGYLYSITYYYSIVDILLSQNLQASRGLYYTVSITSSFSKIIPQFLGELCLTTGMSGIDQQFIHYIHPLAIITILVIISLLARSSRRISGIISRGIIHVICLLLLLSYTSVASTSLLIIRPLIFLDVDKIDIYLSIP